MQTFEFNEKKIIFKSTESLIPLATSSIFLKWQQAIWNPDVNGWLCDSREYVVIAGFYSWEAARLSVHQISTSEFSPLCILWTYKLNLY